MLINIHKTPQRVNCVKLVFLLDYYTSLETGFEITLSCGVVLNVFGDDLNIYQSTQTLKAIVLY